MKISVTSGKKHFTIRLPLSVLKSKLACYVLKKNASLPAAQTEDMEDKCLFEDGDLQEINAEKRGENAVCQPSVEQKFVSTSAFMKELYKVLHNCVKANGHFVLLDVQSSDGEKVQITI